MSIPFICNICKRNFTVKESRGNHRCPFCESFDIEKSAGSFSRFIRSGEFLISAIILISAILIAIVIWYLRSACELKITDVRYDTVKQRLYITAHACRDNRIQYSFDNGKSYQNSNIYQITEAGTFYIKVKDNNNNEDTWPIPFTMKGKGTPTLVPAPQIIGVELTHATRNRNDGIIIIHTIKGKKPITYSIDGGNTYSSDSIFRNLPPNRYNIQVVDELTRIDEYSTVTIREETVAARPPSAKEVENKLNRLFSEPDNKILLDSINNIIFTSESMNVRCDLIGISPNTPYQLFQFLQRRYEGRPGSKKIQVLEVGYNSSNKINYMRVRELLRSN